MSSDISGTTMPSGLSGHTFASLLQAVTGLRNGRAVVAMLGCTFVGVIVAGLVFALARGAGFFSGLLAMLVWIVAIGTGVNAAGLLQMDHARGISPRSTADALVYGLMCIPKLIVLVLAFVAIEIAVLIVLAVLLFICKIPFLGPLLFALVFPLSVLVAGLTITALFLCMVLSLPAIWQGAGISRALAQTFAIVRSRLVEAVLLLFFIGFLAFAVGMIVFGVLGLGLLPTLGMSMSVVGFGGFGMESLIASVGNGYTVAGTIGGALLWAVAGSLVGQVYLLGLSLVYLRVTEGLDLTASEAALRAAFDDTRRRAAALGDKAREATRRDAAGASAAAGAAVAGGATVHDAPPAADPSSAYNPPPAYSAPPAHTPPAYSPSPAYNPPPAYSPPPNLAGTTPSNAGQTAAGSGAHPHGDDPTLPPASVPEADHGPDIALPFDEPAPPAAAAPMAAPPAWAPPPTASAPLPAAAPLPVSTTCPQCLSPVLPDDVFCGVCGYRLK